MRGSGMVIEVYYAAFGTRFLVFEESYHENLFRVNCTPQELDQNLH